MVPTVASRTTSFDPCVQVVGLSSPMTHDTASGEHSAPDAGQTPEQPENSWQHSELIPGKPKVKYRCRLKTIT
jgi:hypothetical protein